MAHDDSWAESVLVCSGEIGGQPGPPAPSSGQNRVVVVTLAVVVVLGMVSLDAGTVGEVEVGVGATTIREAVVGATLVLVMAEVEELTTAVVVSMETV
jgi:hypothetical protein